MVSVLSLKKLSSIIHEIALEIEEEKNALIGAEEAVEKVTESVKCKIFQKVVSETCSDYYHLTNSDNTDCTCPHFQYRLKGTNGKCKHMLKREKYEKMYYKNFYDT